MARCRLLELPPELRNHIYSTILVSNVPIQLSERSSNPFEAARGPTFHFSRVAEPAFLRTCHQIRREALAIFYGDNVFATTIYEALEVWLKAIGPEKTALIRQVRGFRPSRYFNHRWARNFLRAVEKQLEGQGCGLQAGVLRVPFGVEGFEGRVFWLSGGSEVVLGCREGDVEDLTDERFGVVLEGEEGEDGVRLVKL